MCEAWKGKKLNDCIGKAFAVKSYNFLHEYDEKRLMEVIEQAYSEGASKDEIIAAFENYMKDLKLSKEWYEDDETNGEGYKANLKLIKTIVEYIYRHD